MPILRRRRKTTLLIVLVLTLVPAIGLAVLWFNLPSVEGLHARAQPPTTKILDRHGRLLYEIIDPRVGHHTPLQLSKIPLKLQQATIAVEDANFYSNPGVDIIGIMRALWINIRGGEALAGGSTITQQLARLLLLDSEERTQRTLLRKLRESLLAWQIAQRYSKDEVLGLYLNETYYGNLAYGVEAAARAYFGKPATDLDLAECALLAGLPQSPSNYDPFNDPLLAKKRQAIVLGLMQRNAFINEDDMLIAKQSPLSYAPAQFDIRAPHFVSYVRRWLEQEYGTERLVRGSLIVTTTLDLGLNDAGTEIMRTHLRDLAEPAPNAPGHNANNAALIAIDPHTGEILSMIGSPGYFDAKISGAVNAAISLRQPGSAIKPITYAAAFAKLPNFTAATPLFDVRTAFPTREGVPYVPVNYDRRHHGPVSVRAALATSNNVAAVSVLHQIGLPTMIDQGHAMGLSTFGDASQYGLALTLGGGEVRLLDLTAAFGVFAAQGQRVEPIAVREVRTVGGIVLFRGKTTDHRPPTTVDTPLSVVDGRSSVVVSPQIAWLITDILSDNNARAAAFGESSMLRLSRPAAAKTGTTSDWRDNWTVGYTPDLVAGVWVGNANGKSMQQISGVSGAGPIWHDFMELAQRGQPIHDFVRPAGLLQVEVCELSGRLPTPLCPHTRNEWFIAGTEPKQVDTWYQKVRIDAATNLPANASTPPERIVERVQLDLPLPLREWARASGWPLVAERKASSERRAATENSPLAPRSTLYAPRLTILRPDDGAIFRISKELPLSVQRIPIQVQVQDDDVGNPIDHIDLLLASGEQIARFSQSAFTGFWPLQTGQHTLIARATFKDGRTQDMDKVTIQVLE